MKYLTHRLKYHCLRLLAAVALTFASVGALHAQLGGPEYYVINVATGQCMDVQYQPYQFYPQVMEEPCDGSMDQRWKFNALGGADFEVENIVAGECLTVAWASLASGASTVLEPCSQGGEDSQRLLVWSGPQGDNRVVFMLFAHSQHCLDLAGGQLTPSPTRVQQFTCHGHANQTWLLVEAF